MILIGRNLSPFVRRCAVTMEVLGVEYELKVMNTAEDAPELMKFNPLARVPALVLDDGEAIVDSNAILDHLLLTYDTDRKLMPSGGAERRAVMNLSGIALGAMEKGIASAYERSKRPKEKIHQEWLDHIESQIMGGLKALDEALGNKDWLHGDHMTFADISAVIAYDFAALAAKYLLKEDPCPNLRKLAERCGDTPAFTATKPSF